jgi:NADH-quinone oxidoreductase subunit L
MPQYGGLWKKIPITAATFFIAVLAIAGTPFFSGYYSKDMIIAHAGAYGTWAAANGKSQWYWAFWLMPTIIAYVTAFYMMRCWMLTFAGKPRNKHVYDHAHEAPILFIPLVVLAVLSVIGGYIGVRELLVASTVETKHYVEAASGKSFHGYDTAWPHYDPTVKPKTPDVLEGGAAPPQAETPHEATHHDPLSAGWHLVHTIVFWAFIAGIGVGVIVYWKGYWIAAPLTSRGPLAVVRTWLYRRMYFDELYSYVFVAIFMGLSRFSAAFDRYVVDGLVNLTGWVVRRASTIAGLHDKYVVDGAVNGMADLAQNVGAAVRAPQSGRIRMYVTILMAAVALGLAGAIIVALS